MDIKIENKDIALNINGSPVMISGVESAVQQLQLASRVYKGEFIYDRQMGMDVLGKNYMNTEYTNKMLEAMLNEFLINVPDVRVTVISLEDSLRMKKAICKVADSFETMETEVIIFDNL